MAGVAQLFDLPDDPIPPGAVVGMLTTADGVALRWATFPPRAPATRGTVLLLHGRAEFIERWFETVRDLQMRGFAVATFDWRGQGGSTRQAADPRKGHVGDFRAYDFDLDAVLREIVPDLPKPLFILAHSTGGLVTVANAARLTDVVERAVLTAPFLGLGQHGVPERIARRLAGTLRALGFGRAWVPGGSATPVYCTPFAVGRLTSDPARHARGAAQATGHPELAVGSPTIGWLASAFDAMTRIFRPEALEAYRLPTLVVTSGADVVVSNAAIEAFVVATRTTEEIVVPGAKHELLQERDRFREQFWAAFDAFIPGGAAASASGPAARRPGSADHRQPSQHDVVQARIARGDDAAAVGGAAAGP